MVSLDFDEEAISSSPSDSNESAHAQDCDESRDNAPEDKDGNTDLDESPGTLVFENEIGR